jgi:hypothetical protein
MARRLSWARAASAVMASVFVIVPTIPKYSRSRKVFAARAGQSHECQRCGLLTRGNCGAQPAPILSGEVECDEVSIVAGHQGPPEAVRRKNRPGRRRRLKGARGRGTLEKGKPPVLGMLQRGGEVRIGRLENVNVKQPGFRTQKSIADDAPRCQAKSVAGSLWCLGQASPLVPLTLAGEQTAPLSVSDTGWLPLLQ